MNIFTDWNIFLHLGWKNIFSSCFCEQNENFCCLFIFFFRCCLIFKQTSQGFFKLETIFIYFSLPPPPCFNFTRQISLCWKVLVIFCFTNSFLNIWRFSLSDSIASQFMFPHIYVFILFFLSFPCWACYLVRWFFAKEAQEQQQQNNIIFSNQDPRWSSASLQATVLEQETKAEAVNKHDSSHSWANLWNFMLQ